MTFNLEQREICKAKVNKQALPTKYYPFYVAYKYDWWPSVYLIGYDCGFTAIVITDEFKKRGVDAEMDTGYPFELMNPI